MSALPRASSPRVGGAHAALKLASAVSLIFFTVLLPARHASWLAAVALALAVAVMAGRVSPTLLARRLVALSPFVIGVALAAAWNESRVLDWRITALRSTLALTTVVVLTATTTLAEMLDVMRRVRVPAVLLTTLALMDRYVFVLVDETERMRRARMSRTLRPGRGLAWWMAASVIGQLFVRASERAERVYEAMCARGWR